MKLEQVSEHIFSIRAWLLVPIHVWLVSEPEGITLVDAGIRPMSAGILRAVAELAAGPLQRIVLTHGHIDHVGAIDPILARGSVPVYAHAREIPFMEGARPYPRRKKAQQTVKPGIANALPTRRKAGAEAPLDGMSASDGYCEPDGLVARSALSARGENTAPGFLTPPGELAAIGGLAPYHTPGHSPGHVVYYHPADRVLLAGDLFTSRGGELRPPIAMFTADMPEAIRSARLVEQLLPQRLEVCHGGPVAHPAEQLRSYIRRYA